MKSYYSLQEIKVFRRLDIPAKIQDFLNSLKINFEENGQTCLSPRGVLRERKAHCMEGAIFAAAALEFHGHKPLVLDLRATKEDFDHTVAVFRQFGCWGAIGKTNHAVLRFREPVYRDIRELALSYFHEYFDDKGRKNLREYSLPFDLKYFDKYQIKTINSPSPSSAKRGEKLNWRVAEEDLWDIPYELDRSKHYSILAKTQIRNLRRADSIEIRAGKLVERKKPL